MTLTSDLQGPVTNQLAIPNNLGVGTLKILLGLLQRQRGRLNLRNCIFSDLAENFTSFSEICMKKIEIFFCAPNDSKFPGQNFPL
jgi:hypothetical protein